MRKYEIPEMKISMFDETVDTAGASTIGTASYETLKEIKQYRFD